MTQLEEIKKIIASLPAETQEGIEMIAKVFRNAIKRSPATAPLAMALVGAEVSESYDKTGDKK